MSDAEKQIIINQHIGWIKMYLAEMRDGNWKDMRDYAARQVENLEKELCR